MLAIVAGKNIKSHIIPLMICM